MSDEHEAGLTVDKIKQRLRAGYQFYPTQPGLLEAARELIRPIVEKMDEQEIIYECRVPRLMQVRYLETDDKRFRAVATTLHHLGCRIPTIAELRALEKIKAGLPTKKEWQVAVNALPIDPAPFNFGADWAWLRLRGSAVCMNMLTDCFYPSPAVVAEVKAALARDALWEISSILQRASGDE